MTEEKKVFKECRETMTLLQKNTLLDQMHLNECYVKADETDIKSLKKLVQIIDVLYSEEESIAYLKQLAEERTMESAKRIIYGQLGRILKRNGDVDGAIKYYRQIFDQDITNYADMSALARLYYIDKSDISSGIRILRECLQRTSECSLRIAYLYEIIFAIRITKAPEYAMMEEKAYKEMMDVISENKEKYAEAAAVLAVCMSAVMEREDFECFHKLEKVWQSFNMEENEMTQIFRGMQQMVTLYEAGKVHKVIDLFLEEEWTYEEKDIIKAAIMNDTKRVKESLECIKREAPDYWIVTKELNRLEEIVNNGVELLDKLDKEVY